MMSTFVCSASRTPHQKQFIYYLFLVAPIPSLMIIFIFIARKEAIDDIYTIHPTLCYANTVRPTAHYFSESHLLRIWNQSVRSFGPVWAWAYAIYNREREREPRKISVIRKTEWCHHLCCAVTTERVSSLFSYLLLFQPYRQKRRTRYDSDLRSNDLHIISAHNVHTNAVGFGNDKKKEEEKTKLVIYNFTMRPTYSRVLECTCLPLT